MNRISVVVPVFNQVQYLEDCLESVYAQNVHEIIVVNDGSTDNSGEIAERYKFKEFPGIESPVRVIHQVNKGLASARNTGIMNATGDWILFLDSDDMLKENAISKFHEIIYQSQQQNPDIIAPSFEEFGLRDRKVILGGFGIEELKVANRLGYFSLFRRSKLLEVGGYSPKMRWGFEDYHLLFNLFSQGARIMILPDILVKYRVRDNSMITDANRHSDELMGQIKKDFPRLWQ